MSWRFPIGNLRTTDEMRKNVKDVLDSGWFSPGEFVRKFETEFAKMHGAKHCAMVNSGTDALRISLRALKEANGWQDGDEIIVPASTFVATINIVLQCSLKPVLVDIDDKTWVIEGREKLEAVLTPRTRGIIPVHLFGLPADMPRIRLFADTHKLKILQDSCEAMQVGFLDQWGEEAYGKKEFTPISKYGDVIAYSTYACHLLVTGVGGLITTDDDKLFELIRSYANHGRDPIFLGSGFTPIQTPYMLDRRFLYLRDGYSSRPSEFEAAVGLAQLSGLTDQLKVRQKIVDYIKEELREYEFEDVIQLQRSPVNRRHANMMLPVLIKDKSLNRREICEKLEESGIETRYALPLLTQPVYKNMWHVEDYPNALDLDRNGFYIGCHPDATASDLMFVADRMSHIFKEALMKPETPRQRNLQAAQPGIDLGESEGNGWPTPLTDESNPLSYKYTVGKNGESVSKAVHAVQETTTPVHAPEGE